MVELRCELDRIYQLQFKCTVVCTPRRQSLRPKTDDDNNAISSNETFPEVDTAVKEEEKVNGFSKEEEIQINVVDKEKEFKVDGEENKKHTP